ncbi:MAG: VOC family protein [Pseudomonadota bacterium]
MKLDHVNVRTARLAEMRAWYADVLGLNDGWRPDFAFPGAWLYAGEDAVVHLIGVDAAPGADQADLRLEHFALFAGGPAELDAFRARMKSKGIPIREGHPPGAGITQVNIHDPDGNHIHVDFRT